MYFNHAFRKSFLPYVTGGAVSLVSSATDGTASLYSTITPGLIGAFTPDGTALQAASTKPFIIAQGSYYQKDKIGPFHGGYTESVKSKVINPRYITRVIKYNSALPVNEKQQVCVKGLECGKTYRLRLDLKGSPALRYLSHNIYRTLDAFTGCCTDDCNATCTGAIVDPTIAVIKWAKQVVENPILKDFLKVKVTNFDATFTVTQAGTTDAEIKAFVDAVDAYVSTFDPTTDGAEDACLEFEVAFVETKFGDCTFTPTDFYELQPLKIILSMTDETGDPCNVQGVVITETQTAAQAEGLGETVLRELILDGRYRQEAYPDSSRVDSLRMREIEANPSLIGFNKAALYDRVMVLHNVPRFNNPTGTFDNDQYLLVFYVPRNTTTTALTNYFITAANAAQGANTIALETYS
ncbi:MAG: hypothetical protein ACK52I_10135 [Pseudomonadota bacterium]|jgi:hypothetical protein